MTRYYYRIRARHSLRHGAARPRWGGVGASLLAGLALLGSSWDQSAMAQRGRGGSRPTVEHAHHEIQSEALGSEKPLCVFLPPNYDDSGRTRYPVLYYLHGLYNNSDRFFQEGLPEITVRLINEGKVPAMIIVSPTGGASFYVNRADGSAGYEDHVTQEVRLFIEERYPVRADKGGRAIGGISMGGYGAMKIAMRFPEIYGSASAHTPFLVKALPSADRTDMRSRRFYNIFKAVFGDPPSVELWKQNDPFELASRFAPEGLPLYFNAASKDRYFLNIEANAFHNHLEEIGFRHTFRQIDDVHGWASLRPNWEEVLQFHAEQFTSPAQASGAQ